MGKSHIKADPQTWANSENLTRILEEDGLEAAAEELERMLGGALPKVEQRHLMNAAVYRQMNDLPPLLLPNGMRMLICDVAEGPPPIVDPKTGKVVGIEQTVKQTPNQTGSLRVH